MYRPVIQEKKLLYPLCNNVRHMSISTLYSSVLSYLSCGYAVFCVCPDCKTKFPIQTIKLTPYRVWQNRHGTAHICPALSVRHDKFTSHPYTKTHEFTKWRQRALTHSEHSGSLWSAVHGQVRNPPPLRHSVCQPEESRDCRGSLKHRGDGGVMSR